MTFTEPEVGYFLISRTVYIITWYMYNEIVNTMYIYYTVLILTENKVMSQGVVSGRTSKDF